MQYKEPNNQLEKRVFQVSQKVLIYRPDEKKFLLARCSDEESTFNKKYGPWDLAGGRIDDGEDINEAIPREIREELGKDMQYELDPLLIPLTRNIFEYGTTTVMNIGFMARYIDGEIHLSEDHSEICWVTAEEVEKGEYQPWIKEFVKSAAERLKAEEYLNDLKRLQADFENYKKRQQESQKELGGYLIEKLVLDIIPVLDNFRAATMHVPDEQKESPWVVGIQYIEKQLEDVIRANGVEVVEVAEGDVFDPTIHEAVSRGDNGEKTEETDEQHKVEKVLQKGFRLGGKVVRPAKVIVK